MARVPVPYEYGVDTWNEYIEQQANASPDQSMEARRLIKRNIKLAQIASVERYAGGDTTSPSWRVYNDYETPGTFSPTIGHPWLTDATDTLAQFQMENSSNTISTEDNYELTAEGPLATPYPPAYSAGVYAKAYSGYHGDVPTWFASQTSISNSIYNNFEIPSPPSNYSVEATGYFKADYTGTWTFTMTSDDGAYLWLGDAANTTYTTSNSLVNDGGLHGTVTISNTINLVSGSYYPLRLQYGNGPASGVLSITYSHPGQTATNNFTGKLFYNPVTNGL